MGFVSIATGNWANVDHMTHVYYVYNAGNWDVRADMVSGSVVTLAVLGSEALAQTYVGNLVEILGTVTVD
jgi:hypothetical protein